MSIEAMIRGAHRPRRGKRRRRVAQPLGLAVVGGLLFSQTLTLYVTSVFYLYMEKLRTRAARRKARRGWKRWSAKRSWSTTRSRW
jgi:hypothetical protein